MAVISKDEIVIDLKVENQQAIDTLSGKLESLNKKSGETKGRFIDMGAGISSASDKIRNKIVQAFPEAEGAINRASSAFSGLKSAGESGAKGLFSIGNALKLLGGGVIAVVVTGVTALVGYLSKLAPVMDKIEQITAGVSAGFLVLGQRVATFGGGLGKIFSGDFKGALEDIKNSFTGIGSEISNAANQAARLKKEFQDIQDDKAIFNVDEATVRNQINILNAQYKDLSKSAKQKEEINNRIIELENYLQDKRAQLDKRAEENFVNAAINQNKNVKLTAKQIQTLKSFTAQGLALAKEIEDKGFIIDTDAYEKLALDRAAALNRSAVSEERAITKRNTQIEKQRQAAEKAREEADKLAKKKEEDNLVFLKTVRELEADVLEDGLDKELLIIVNNGREKKEAIAKLEISDADKKKAFALIDENTRNELKNAGDKYLEQLEAFKLARKKEIEELSFDALIFQRNDKDSFDKALANAKKFNDQLQKDKKAEKEAKSQAKEDLDKEGKDLLNSSLNIQDQILQATVDRVDSEIAIQEGKINRLKELAEFGSAESLQLEEDRLDRLQAKREQAVQNQKKLAAVQIAINNALSASEAIKVVLESASTDPTGGLLTAVRVASILALIGSTVIGINSAFASVPAFKEGTDYVQGPGTETSDSITARLSKGERVVNAYQNKDLRSMGIITNKDLVEYAKLGKSVSDVKIEVPGQGKDYTENFNELVRENKMMRKKLERLEIHMGISNEGIYGMITSMEEKQTKLNKLKA
jgi:hypothetical protein